MGRGISIAQTEGVAKVSDCVVGLTTHHFYHG